MPGFTVIVRGILHTAGEQDEPDVPDVGPYLPAWFGRAAFAAVAVVAVGVLVWSIVTRNPPDTSGRDTCRVQAERSWPDNPTERVAAYNECVGALPR